MVRIRSRSSSVDGQNCFETAIQFVSVSVTYSRFANVNLPPFCFDLIILVFMTPTYDKVALYLQLDHVHSRYPKILVSLIYLHATDHVYSN